MAMMSLSPSEEEVFSLERPAFCPPDETTQLERIHLLLTLSAWGYGQLFNFTPQRGMAELPFSAFQFPTTRRQVMTACPNASGLAGPTRLAGVGWDEDPTADSDVGQGEAGGHTGTWPFEGI